MKIWITKWAVTGGILEHEATDCDGGFVKVDGYYCYFYPTEYSLTREDAVVKAELMRVKKCKSLQRQLEKLQAKRFK